MSDILRQALEEMKVGDEMIVSLRTFRNIRVRFLEFQKTNRMMKFIVRPDTGLQRIVRRG